MPFQHQHSDWGGSAVVISKSTYRTLTSRRQRPRMQSCRCTKTWLQQRPLARAREPPRNPTQRRTCRGMQKDEDAKSGQRELSLEESQDEQGPPLHMTVVRKNSHHTRCMNPGGKKKPLNPSLPNSQDAQDNSLQHSIFDLKQNWLMSCAFSAPAFRLGRQCCRHFQVNL